MALYELHGAVQEGHPRRVNDLLSESPPNIDINERDSRGWTPLMYAVSIPDAGIELLRTLIRHGAIIDQTTVSYALSDIQKLTELTEAGADLRYQTEQACDALINAAYGHDVLQNPRLPDILNLLISNGVSLRGMTTYGESGVRCYRESAALMLCNCCSGQAPILTTKIHRRSKRLHSDPAPT